MRKECGKLNYSNVVSNINVYNMSESFRASKYPMATDINKTNYEITDRIKKLSNTPMGTGHSNFLKGILVSFDLTFTIKAWTEAERYSHFTIVSSQSTMHRIARMDYDDCMIEYVTDNTKKELERLKAIYNKTKDSHDYLRLLYNCPTGLKLTAHISTNYMQLKTIYNQRKDHRLPEWKSFCDFIESLPYSELIIGED